MRACDVIHGLVFFVEASERYGSSRESTRTAPTCFAEGRRSSPDSVGACEVIRRLISLLKRVKGAGVRRSRLELF